jgi:hypothetical protein
MKNPRPPTMTKRPSFLLSHPSPLGKKMAGPRRPFSRRGPGCGRVDKPNSVPLRAATIYLGAMLPSPSSNLPGACVPPFPDPDESGLRTPDGTNRLLLTGAGGAARVTPWAPYLVLHPVGFSMPPLLPATRCALTAPFHPCLIPGCPGPSAVYFLWHYPAPGRAWRFLA